MKRCAKGLPNHPYKRASTSASSTSESPTQWHVQENQAVLKSVENVYLNDLTSDVSFVFNSKERVPAHKALLAGASDVFKAMFFGPSKENGDVKMVGISAAAFKEFLQFFYLAEVRLIPENVAEVLGLGHKYNVTNCIDVCVNLLKETLTNDNVCITYALAILYDQQYLKTVCEGRIAQNPIGMFKSQGFLECDRSVLANILKIGRLSCRAKDVFEACMSWVKSTSDEEKLTREIIQIELGELFYEIQFGSMTLHEFNTISLAYDWVFSFDEYKEILHMIANPQFEAKLFKKKTSIATLKSRTKRYDYFDFEDYDL